MLGGPDLVVAVFDVDAERLERDRGLAAHVGAGVERRQVEVSAAVERIGPRAVAEQEVLELGSDVEGVEAQVRRSLDRAAQDVARVALIRRALRRQHVAEHPSDALLLRPPWQHGEGRGVGHRDHVRLLDRVEAGDRRAVEAHSGLERAVELGGVDRERLQLPDHVGEPHPDEADLALGDDRPDVLCCDLRLGHRTWNYADASEPVPCPALELSQRRGELLALVRQRVLHPHRRPGKDGALDQGMRFEFLEAIREHPVREVRHGRRDHREAQRPALHQDLQDRAGPAATDQLDGRW